MSRRGRLVTASAVAAFLGMIPGATSAHALGSTFQLPVPLGLYLAGAATAVAASFVVSAIVFRRHDPASAPRLRPVPMWLGSAARIVLRNLGIAWWYGAIAVGFVIGDISPLPAVLFWIGIWVGLPMIAAVLGNAWPALSPFRTTFAALEWLAARLGAGRLDLGVRYPAGLARWPAVTLLAVGIWAELILPSSASAPTVALLMLAYTLLTLAGMLVFGQVAWLRSAEVFEVELAWFGRVGPIGRRATSDGLCAGCREECDPARCIDCPECAVAADDREREPGWRPWVAGLTDVARAGWSDAAFILLALAGVSYDGLRETGIGAAILELLLPPVTDVLGMTLEAFIVIDTTAFGLVVVTFVTAFASVLWLTRRIARVSTTPAGAFASTLLPIAAGYVIAHYLTLVIQGAIWVPQLIFDPLASLIPDISWFPIGLVWYLSVAAIVGGHIAAVVLAHRIALRDSPGRAVVAGLPMVGLMIGYTVLSLWIIAQPIVIDPATAPPSAVGR